MRSLSGEKTEAEDERGYQLQRWALSRCRVDSELPDMEGQVEEPHPRAFVLHQFFSSLMKQPVPNMFIQGSPSNNPHYIPWGNPQPKSLSKATQYSIMQSKNQSNPTHATVPWMRSRVASRLECQVLRSFLAVFVCVLHDLSPQPTRFPDSSSTCPHACFANAPLGMVRTVRCCKVAIIPCIHDAESSS